MIYRINVNSQKLNTLPVCHVQDGVLSYGVGNSYIETQKYYYERSGICAAAVDKYADFIMGRGFEDVNFGKSKANKKQTFNNVLSDIAADKAFIDTIAIHVTYNSLAQITELRAVPVNYVRIREDGKYSIWNNWLRNEGKLATTTPETIFPFAPDLFFEQVDSVGGIDNHNGQLLYLNKSRDNIYSLSTFDSVENDVISDIQYSNYRKNSVQNSFSMGGILKYNGYIESDLERQKIVERVQSSSQGSDNAGNILVVFPDSNEIATEKNLEFLRFTPVNNDKLFDTQYNQCVSRIIGAFNQPRALHTFFDDSGIYNQDLLNNAWAYYNEQTRRAREDVTAAFEQIMPYFIGNVASNFNIKPQQITWQNSSFL